ncbi:hypothetical protein F2P81_006444 [Scophthalmus maximus]|uniref:Uncharacterized protein n=1 Tax=Scophthalmus maximus TaxID=52904 RepID=A0A6A4SZ51_SCOMX|nr:hypothetical protein F2P81_006444 [Scophthalmus maximus]
MSRLTAQNKKGIWDPMTAHQRPEATQRPQESFPSACQLSSRLHDAAVQSYLYCHLVLMAARITHTAAVTGHLRCVIKDEKRFQRAGRAYRGLSDHTADDDIMLMGCPAVFLRVATARSSGYKCSTVAKKWSHD